MALATSAQRKTCHVTLRGGSGGGVSGMRRASCKFLGPHSSAHDMVRRDAGNVASPLRFASLSFARLCRNPAPAAPPGKSENRLLREDENGFGKARVRSPTAQARSGSTMLRGLRLRARRHSRNRDTVCLSASRRRKFRSLHFVRAHPLATTSCSTAARLISLQSRRLVPVTCGNERKGNSTGGFYEISLCDHCGPGAGRHSERDFAFG